MSRFESIPKKKIEMLGKSMASQTEIEVFGSHFVGQDSPDAIARGIVKWMEVL